jgi:hypothetical protein
MPVPLGSTLRFGFIKGIIENRTDPNFIVDDDRSPPYRNVVYNPGSGASEIWESDDLINWSRTTGSIDLNGVSTIQSRFKNFDDYYFAANGGDGTVILEGSSLTDLSQVDTAIDQNDCGAYWDGETAYVICEQADPGVSSFHLDLWTAPHPEGPYTKQGTVLDLTGEGFDTGDPEFIEVNGTLQMFIDNHYSSGSSYYIARCEPDNDELSSWSLVDPNATWRPGGDFEPFVVDGRLMALTEFSVGGIGLWEEAHVNDDGIRVPRTMVA